MGRAAETAHGLQTARPLRREGFRHPPRGPAEAGGMRADSAWTREFGRGRRPGFAQMYLYWAVYMAETAPGCPRHLGRARGRPPTAAAGPAAAREDPKPSGRAEASFSLE